MWEAIVWFFQQLFQWIRPKEADFQGLIKSQRESYESLLAVASLRITATEKEFQDYRDRKEEETNQIRERLDRLEQADQKCREALAAANERIRMVEEEGGRALRLEQEKVRQLRTKLAVAKKALQEVHRVKLLHEDPAFQERTAMQQRQAMSRETKVDPPPPSEEGA